MRPQTLVLSSIVLIILGAVLASTAIAAPPAAACPRGPGTDASCPIRVQFAAGTYGTTVHGRLTLAPDHRYYVVRARAGQRMILSFVGAGAMRGGVSFPDGSGDGPFNSEADAIHSSHSNPRRRITSSSGSPRSPFVTACCWRSRLS